MGDSLKDSGGSSLSRFTEELRSLLRSFRFTPSQKREVWDAFLENPDGLERCAYRAQSIGERHGRSGAGILITMVRNAEHLLEANPDTPLVTGWRWVRGAEGAAGTYVKDPGGVDRLPAGYDFGTHNPDASRSVRYPEDNPTSIPDQVRSQLKRLGVRVENVRGRSS